MSEPSGAAQSDSEQMEEQRVAIEAELETVRAANRQLQREIRSMGADVAPASVLLARIDAVIDSLWGPPGTIHRSAFDLTFERRMAAILEDTRSQVTKARLQVPPPSNGFKLPPPGRH